MFFVLSKIAGFFLQPLNAVIVLAAVGGATGFAGWLRSGFFLCLVAAAVMALAGWTTTGALLLHPLESRFTRPAEPLATVAGIVVLGGGFEGAVNQARGGYELNSSGDRFVEAAILARRYPDAKVVISGGSGALMIEGEADATTAERLLEALGVGRDRMILESRSRNTDENARFTRALVEPKPGETWLLVTSAFHMPRSVGLFRANDFAVTPWPTDYRTTGNETIGLFQDNVADAVQNTTLAIREWIGLLTYRLSGRTNTLLPAPG